MCEHGTRTCLIILLNEFDKSRIVESRLPRIESVEALCYRAENVVTDRADASPRFAPPDDVAALAA